MMRKRGRGGEEEEGEERQKKNILLKSTNNAVCKRLKEEKWSRCLKLTHNRYRRLMAKILLNWFLFFKEILKISSYFLFLALLILHLYFCCMNASPACMCILHVFAGSLWRSEDSIRLPGTEFRGGRKPQNARWNQTQVLCRSSQCSLSLSHLSKNPWIGFYRVSCNTLFTEELSKLKLNEETIRNGSISNRVTPRDSILRLCRMLSPCLTPLRWLCLSLHYVRKIQHSFTTREREKSLVLLLSK